jgi:hypothetical protein
VYLRCYFSSLPAGPSNPRQRTSKKLIELFKGTTLKKFGKDEFGGWSV